MPNFLECVKPTLAPLDFSCRARIVRDMPTSVDKPFADIGERLRWHREDVLGVDQAEYVARTKTVKRSAYSNWEVGSSRLSLNGAMEIAEAYKLSLDFLYFGNADTLPMALRNAWMSKSSVKT